MRRILIGFFFLENQLKKMGKTRRRLEADHQPQLGLFGWALRLDSGSSNPLYRSTINRDRPATRSLLLVFAKLQSQSPKPILIMKNTPFFRLARGAASLLLLLLLINSHGQSVLNEGDSLTPKKGCIRTPFLNNFCCPLKEGGRWLDRNQNMLID